MKKLILSFIFVRLSVNFALCAEKSILVNQPAYQSMNFYVYKPANLHKDFYVTYDGFLVYKDSKGIWHYGSYDKNGITKTNYVVGSVIPTVVRLKPYDPKISSVAPIIDTPQVEKLNESKTSRIRYMPPSQPAKFYESVNLTPNAADWTQNSKFMSLGKWQKSVDRIAILDKPKTPVAWKGEYPDVVFAWTGLQWRQLNAKSGSVTALNILRRESYALTVHTNKVNLLHWTDEDSYVLSQYARMWGYQWLGQIFIEREY